MNELIQFLLRHGYLLLFAWVLAEQIGLPMPSSPLLLAAGALAGSGRMNFGLAIAAALAGAGIADSVWYQIGRSRGAKVLNLLCRISLEPDSCVRKTENLFARNGARSLLVAKFVPGLGAAAPPLAGIFGMRYSRFLFYDSAGSLAWAGFFMGLGFVFTHQIGRVARYALRLGTGLSVLAIGSLAGYILWKYFQRQRFIRKLRIARITSDELKRKLDAGENVIVVDLRHSLDFEADPNAIPGALHVPAEEFDRRHDEIPRDRDIVLYCT
jgi:membrane protein DedA with SNARE-associated domain